VSFECCFVKLNNPPINVPTYSHYASKTYRVKWRHSKLWSHYDLCVVGQYGVLFELRVKICRVIRIKSNQLV